MMINKLIDIHIYVHVSVCGYNFTGDGQTVFPVREINLKSQRTGF